MATCGECGGNNPGSARFCVSCGAAIASRCHNCEAALVPGGGFCPSCGVSVGETDIPAETIKLVTILFADVVGSTAMGERMAPEDTRAVIAEFLDAMSEEVRGQGGIVERLVGDAIMADFGVPVSREDDAVRAVRAAIRMMARLEELNAGKDADTVLEIRIGINTGDVSTGGSLGDQLLVMGDAVNVAARLQQAAQPGTILIGHRTARAVRGRFSLRAVAAFEAKGKSEGVNAFVVEREAEEGDTRGELSAPLIGRASELDRLHSMLLSAQAEGTPHVVTVLGEAGVGKTRLLREFLNAVGENTRTLVGRCLPYGEGITLWPLREMVRAEAGLLPTDGPGAALQKISRFVRSIGTRGLEMRPEQMTMALGVTVGLEAAFGATNDLDPREVRRELIHAWRCLVSELARTTPLVMVIEDLHWADPTTLDVLGDVVTDMNGMLLVLATARPDASGGHPRWASATKNYASLYLDPLKRVESTELISSLLGVVSIPEGLYEQVLEKAEGNPFFIEEILQHLIDEGAVHPHDGLWKVAGGVSEWEVPDNVHAVIQARIETLSLDERRVLQHAAVVGRTFWSGAIEQLVEGVVVEAVLRDLTRKQLVVELPTSSIPPDSEFTFKHILIRDVAYESLPRTDRGRAHAALARWIEHQSPEAATELADLLAHHYERAFHWLRDEELRERARRYSLEASHHGIRRFAVHQAETYGRQAVAQSRGPVERAEALEALGDVYALMSSGDAAWRTFTEALTEITSTYPIDDGAIARIASKATIIPTRFEAAMDFALAKEEIDAVINAGVRSAGAGDSPERTLLLVSKAFLQGAGYAEVDEEGHYAAEEALRVAQRLGDPDLISAALDAVGQLKMAEGRYDEFERVNRRRIDLVPHLTSVTEACDAYGVAAYLATYIGRYRDAIEYATAAIDRSRGIEPADYWHGFIWRIQSQFMAGEWDAALVDQADLERENRFDRDVPPGSVIRGYGVALLIHQLRGEHDEVRRYEAILRRYRDGTKEEGLSFAAPLALPARAFAHRGLVSEARDWLNLDRTLYLGGHLEAMCDVIAEEQDWESARKVIEMARGESERGGLIALPFFADRLEGRMAVAAGDDETARLFLQQSATGFAAIGVPWESAWSSYLLAEVLTRSNDPDATRVAEYSVRVFERLGSVRELDSVSSLLARV